VTDVALGIAALLAALVAALEVTELVAAVPDFAASEVPGAAAGCVVEETVAVIEWAGADSDAASNNAGTNKLRFMIAPFIGAAATSRGSRCRGRRSRR
jgi:hypothetical protein